ncbi:MAG: ArsA family ATPase [Deltaproteobacteria bacterium]|nr:ArsA family ATPase [Deltaproteobacteria bacterium]
MPPTIAELLTSKRVLLCVGTGGVGKTTLSAALGIAAARLGRRTLVLTVDPARRLANALGLQAFDEQVQRIAVPRGGAQQPATSLDASMLDVKRTFDRVVTRYARSQQSAQRILGHPFYVQASTALAGSQEYMATERLYECATCGQWDLVILDTPPAEHALDFLDAPRRLIDLFGSPAFRKVIAPSRRLNSGVFRSGSMVMRGLQRFTSVEMFSNLLEFFGDLSETFDGFVQRAEQVQALVTGPDAAFILVSACDPTSSDQAASLGRQLRAQRMLPAAWLVNRVLALDPALDTDPVALTAALAREWRTLGDALGRDVPHLAEHVAQTTAALGRLAAADLAVVQRVRDQASADMAVVPVARRDDEPHDLIGLSAIAQALVAPTQA